MMSNGSRGGGRSTGDLSDMLAKAIATQERIEKDYRDQYVKNWAVMFVNVFDSAKPLYKEGEDVVTATMAQFRTITTSVLQAHQACYIAPGDGPQVVVCFDNMKAAVHSAIDVQRTLAVWNKTRAGLPQLIPSIGIKYGDVVFKDDILEQSNTCNIAKRVETEASPGQIYLSEEVAVQVDKEGDYPVEFVKSAFVKNIPDAQNIFELQWEEVGAIRPARTASASPSAQATPAAGAAKRPSATSTKPAHRTAQALAESLGGNKEVIENQVILVIDVCESSKKFYKLGDRAANELIRDYRNVVHPVCKKYRCAACDSVEGDMVIAVFSASKPSKALDAAAEIQQVLLKRNLTMPENKRVRAAVGLHLGEVKRQGNKFVKGRALQNAKALQGAAVDDEILVSGDLYDGLVDQIQYDIRYEKECKFKDTPDPITVYKFHWHGDQGSQSTLEQRKLQVGLQNALRARKQ